MSAIPPHLLLISYAQIIILSTYFTKTSFLFVLTFLFHVYLLLITAFNTNVLSIWPPSKIRNFCKFGQISCAHPFFFFNFSIFQSQPLCTPLSIWFCNFGPIFWFSAFLLPYDKTFEVLAIKFNSGHIWTEITFILLTFRAYTNSMCQINVRFRLIIHTKKCK